MFNVSALLLGDALKPATPLTNGANNETLRQKLSVPLSCIVANFYKQKNFKKTPNTNDVDDDVTKHKQKNK